MFDSCSNTDKKHPECRYRSRIIRVALPLLLAAVPACQTYRPDPIDPSAILQTLNASRVEAPSRDDPAGGASEDEFDPRDGLTVREAVSLAVDRNPSLRQLRAENGVAAAQLIEAGLLPDPEFGWEATEWIVETNTDAALSGLGVSWELPRPGERNAKKGAARGRIEEVRYRVLTAEWKLARQVALAYLGVLAARERLALNDRLLEVARQTHEYFLRGRRARAATALQENLAAIELANVEAGRQRLLLDAEEAKQALNRLLGLPPALPVELQATDGEFAFVPESHSAGETVAAAVRSRPDLKALLAVYEQAEAAVQLEVKRQWPRLSIGTGIGITLPVFSRFNKPAIRTRLEQRKRVRFQVEAAIHELRQEVHAALTELERNRRQAEYFEKNIAPRLTESLRFAAAARSVREITPVELLTAQRQVLDAETRYLEARIEYRRSRELVATVSGRWIAPAHRQSGKEQGE